MTTKTQTKISQKPHASRKLAAYIKDQPVSKLTLSDVQKSLSHTGISLSKRISEEREKR